MAKSSGNYGFAAFNQNQNPQLSNSSLETSGGSLFSARVISIVLDETHPRFNELGGWAALGAIEYDLVDSTKYGLSKYPVAYPLNTSTKKFPLKNEVVICTSAFSSGVKLYEKQLPILNGQSKIYYTNIVNVWNHPHHNGYSFKINETPSSQNKSYSQTQAGSTSIPTDKPITINLGRTFKERINIHPLSFFEGDTIYEGRWGNSIRLGSTVKNSFNNWSLTGTDGDPITIIRNGQGIQTDEGWIPVTENINNDDSSIYLTSTQKVPLKASSISYISYDTNNIPISPQEYAGAQMLLDSGRLVFNSWEDHILLSSAKSINLNSQTSVNIDTKKFITQADKIFLGKEDLATEPLLLGDTTAQLLRDLTSSVKDLATALQFLKSDPVVPNTPATFITDLAIPSTKVLGILENLEKQLGSSPESCTITSKRNFTL